MYVMSSNSAKLKDNLIKFKEKIILKPEITWEDENFKNWKIIAEEKQEFYCEALGDRSWEEYKENEVEFLKLKIGFAIYGPCADVLDDSIDEPIISFKNLEHEKAIEQILQAIQKNSATDCIYCAFIFIIALFENEYVEFPIIRILNKETKSIFFLDMLGRVYKDWDDFNKNNALPNCICCYPNNGFYLYNNQGKVDLYFELSPGSSKLRRALRKIDTVNAVAGIGSAAVGVAALALPVSAPLVLGSAVTGLASGLWSTCRTLHTMVDRKKHSQTLSLSDHNARACWLSLAGGILGGASAGAMQYTEFIARSGQALSRIPCLAINSLEISSLGIGGLSVVNHIVTIVQKKECTVVDSTQLILSVLFFFHASLSFRTAKTIILDIQQDILKNVEKELNLEQQNAFLSVLQNNRRRGLMEGNAEIIKSLKVINDKQKFFKELVIMKNEATAAEASLTMSGDGLITINDTVKISAGDFNSLKKESQTMLMKSSQNLVSDLGCRPNLAEEISTISKHEKLQYRTEEICKKLNVNHLNEFCLDDKQLLTAASPDEIHILYKTIKTIETSQNNKNAFDRILNEVKKSVSCHNFQEFLMLIQNILRKYTEYKETYEAVKKLIEEFRILLKKNREKEKSSTEGMNEIYTKSVVEK